MTTHPSVYITHEDLNSGDPIKIETKNIKVNGSVNINISPDVSSTNIPVEAHTSTVENFKYTLVGTITDSTSPVRTLTWDDIITLYKKTYDGTNYAILNVQYGTDKVLSGLSESTDIKVWMQKPGLTLDASNSKDARLGGLNLEFVETG